MNPEELSHQYDPLAATFSEVIHEGNRVSREAFRAILPDLKDKKVLDMGCGEGSDAMFYRDQGAEVIGLDASKELLERAKVKFPDIRFEYGTFESTSFADQEFDVVFSKYALMTSA